MTLQEHIAQRQRERDLAIAEMRRAEFNAWVEATAPYAEPDPEPGRGPRWFRWLGADEYIGPGRVLMEDK